MATATLHNVCWIVSVITELQTDLWIIHIFEVNTGKNARKHQLSACIYWLNPKRHISLSPPTPFDRCNWHIQMNAWRGHAGTNAAVCIWEFSLRKNLLSLSARLAWRCLVQGVRRLAVNILHRCWHLIAVKLMLLRVHAPRNSYIVLVKMFVGTCGNTAHTYNFSVSMSCS
jgi:hypothetical protein